MGICLYIGIRKLRTHAGFWLAGLSVRCNPWNTEAADR